MSLKAQSWRRTKGISPLKAAARLVSPLIRIQGSGVHLAPTKAERFSRRPKGISPLKATRLGSQPQIERHCRRPKGIPPLKAAPWSRS